MRRVAIVLAIYAVVALVVMPATDWAKRLFALPDLFRTLVRVGLVGGLPVAAWLAWKYPTLGDPEATGDSPPEA